MKEPQENEEFGACAYGCTGHCEWLWKTPNAPRLMDEKPKEKQKDG